MGLTETDSLPDALRALSSLLAPAATAVVNDGAAGATLLSSAGSLAVPARPITVRDTIGAGDVFNAGYLAALHKARPARAPWSRA